MDEAQKSYLNLLKKTFEKKQEFIRYDVVLFQQFQNKLTVHSAAISRNCELLVCGCSKSIVILYDLISKQVVKASNKKQLQFRKHQIVTVAFSNCYDYVLAGNTMGDLLIYEITIDIQNQKFQLDLIRFISQYHEKALQIIFHSSIDHLLTISSDKLRVTMISEFIQYENIDQSPNQIQQNLGGATTSKLSYYNNHYYLYIGLRNNKIVQIRSSQLYSKPKNETFVYSINSSSSVISKIEVSNDQTLLAIAYQSAQQESGNLQIVYLKKGKQIYSQNGITKLKISQLLFFNSNSHLCISSWDGTFQILDIKSKEILKTYSHIMHEQGVITFYPLSEASEFPNLISIGQDHQIKKYYFGKIKEQLFEYIPFIFWVEQRIRQELQFQSELHNYQKLLYIESMGVDSVKMRELNQSIFGFEKFNPLIKRIIDYTEYKERAHILYKRYELEIQQSIISSIQRSNKLPPLDLQQKNSQNDAPQNLIQSGILVNPNQYQEPLKLFQEYFTFTFKRISDTIIFERIKLMVLQKCDFIFDDKYPFKQLLFSNLKRMKNLKYLDLSYNSLNLEDVLQILDQLKNVTLLDFLSLAHNNLGDSQTIKFNNSDAVMRLLDEVEAISLRSNNLSDIDGEAILNQIKHFKKLKILDISGNLSFKDRTLQALQRITILQNKIEFSSQRNDFLNFLNNIKVLQEKEQQEELEDQAKSQDKQSNINEDQKLIENLPEQQPSQTLDRSASISSSGNYMSLQLLCIQFQKEVCEQAMKTATDFLVQRKITNLYIYVVDNKEDDVWETSISIFYTRDLKKWNDYIFGCIGGFFTVMFSCLVGIYKNIRQEGFYCIRRIFCTNYFLWKYLACGFCTFLTTTLGRFIVKLFGVEQSYFEYNPKIYKLEQELISIKYIGFILFTIYFVSYYFVVVFLPIIFVNACSGQQWIGHLIYIAFAVYSFLVEGYLGLKISNLRVTTNEYTDGNTLARYFYIIKDLLISQLTKFELYTCICFIVLVNSCQISVALAWIGVGIICFNLLLDLALIIRYLLVPYVHQKKLSYIDIFTQFSTLYQMNIVTNLLEKWSEQNTIYIFFLKSEVPQKVVVSIIKTFFQDTPLLILQAVYLAMNQDQIKIQIFIVSFITVIIHFIFSMIKMLSITRAAKINEEIVLTEVSKAKFQSKEIKIIKELKKFIRNLKKRFQKIIGEHNQRNENLTLSLVDAEKALLNRPHTMQNFELYKKQKSSKILPARKGITQIGNKIQRINFSKYQKINQEELQKQISVKASLDIFGAKVKSWKINNEIPLDITDTLLNDVPRQFFTIDLDWEASQTWIGNIRISSLKQEIQGFIMAYQHFQNQMDLNILDLGFGSGYVSFVLLALALRRKSASQIQLHLVDHHPDAIKYFEQKLNSEFAHLKTKCKIQFHLHDCFDGLNIFQSQKFNFIHVGYATTKWRIQKDVIPLLSDDGLIFGYEIVSSLEQKAFSWNQTQKQMVYTQNFEQYGIMEPLAIQLKGIDQSILENHIKQKLDILKYIKLYDQCALCDKLLTKDDKQFINHYWGEGLCMNCANDQLEQQGEEIDIAKINYRCNLIFYTGSNCKLSSIKQVQSLLENLTYPFGHKVGTIREYTQVCASCNSKRGFGFLYTCLICNSVNYCNTCGLQLMRDNQLKYHSSCNNDHPLLRIVFPWKAQKGKK
ncbi:unnamed protein product [Paramecium sonneborni]|uniref:Uncharacterized protein n=1 Tax=Paramecium sonneborni TaxID=65129 RepID=A0A8S1N5T7_9CILI|nr:unnamed protein product [Paramecium sonneborni]